MKGLKEKKGFTLIELLAVIVVLAIVMVLAATTVLPYMSKAQKNAFAIEANTAIDAASQAMSLISIGSIEGSAYQISGTDNYCFDLTDLVNLGLWDKDKNDVAPASGTPKYVGAVTVTAPSTGKAYTYSLDMKNDSFYVKAAGGNIDGEFSGITDTEPTGFDGVC